jgi:membrane fusion protein (multidrug efflux system)
MFIARQAIEIDVINQNGKFKPGMYAEVKIPMRSGAKSLIVPNTVIVRSTERGYVVAVRDGKAKLIDIKKGMAGRDSTEIFGALFNKDLIVTKASDDIQEGVTIK